MKTRIGYPKAFDGRQTTKEEWDRYDADMKAHIERVERDKPFACDYETDEDFEKALSEWEMMKSMDEPNKPGYYRANND